MTQQINPYTQEAPDPFANQPLSERLWLRFRNAPWWIIILVLMFVYAGFRFAADEDLQDILNSMVDQPVTTTDDKFDVVYEVDTEVLIVDETISLKLADESRIIIGIEDVVSREPGTLICDKEADPQCVDEFGDLVTFRVPAPEGETPEGTYEQRGLLRPIGNAVELANGELIIVPEDQISSVEEDGVLECDRGADPACEDKTGTIATYQVPYVLRQGLVTREDVVIQHEDGFRESVRPNRLSSIDTESCTREESPVCSNGEIKTAVFVERVIGTETERNEGVITVRTVDEDTILIPRERIISMEMGTVECARDLDPRCQDYEGTIVQRRGAVTSGELTLENNRALSVIPEGESTAVEIRKASVVSDVRTPEGCRVEDEGVCMIVVEEADDVVAGRIVGEDDAGITVQTVPPKFIEIEESRAEATRRAPQVCALNNVRGCNAGVWLTLMVTIVAYALALFIGLVFGLMRVSSNPILYQLSTLYVEIIRGMPLLVLLLFFAFVVGPIMRDSGIAPIVGFYNAINAIERAVLGEENFLGEAVLGLAIGYGAFLAEVFRAGIQSIGRGQMEAARSLGMSYPQAMRKVILPQAIRVVLPPLGNDFIAMLKDSALISVLALPDLLQMGRLYITRTFQPIPVYIVVALLYILMTLILSMGVRALERRFRLP